MPNTVCLDGASVVLTTAEQTVVMPPSPHEYTIGVIRFCNTDSADHQVTIYKYTGAGPGTDATAQYKLYTIQARTTFEYGPVWLPSLKKITALADANSVITATPEGLDVVGPP